MKRLLLLAIVIVLVMPVTASAHVMVLDETQSKGAILHIIPDDDPVAGEKSTLFFDMQNQVLEKSKNSKVTLTITSGSNQNTDVPVRTKGSLVTASYVFPAQGLYTVQYKIKTDTDTYLFSYLQRVSRGAVVNPLTPQTHTWAEILVIGSAISIILLLITAINRRKLIIAQSRL